VVAESVAGSSKSVRQLQDFAQSNPVALEGGGAGLRQLEGAGEWVEGARGDGEIERAVRPSPRGRGGGMR
jgi:hypothetical protein